MGRDGMVHRLKREFGKAPSYEQLQELHAEVAREQREARKRKEFFEERANKHPVLSEETAARLRLVKPDPEPAVPGHAPEQDQDMGMKARPAKRPHRHADDFRDNPRGDNGSIYPDDFIEEVDQALQNKPAGTTSLQLLESYGFPGGTDFYRLRSNWRRRRGEPHAKPRKAKSPLAELAPSVAFGGKKALNPERLVEAARTAVMANDMSAAGASRQSITRACRIGWTTLQKYLDDPQYLRDARKVLAAAGEAAPVNGTPASTPPPAVTVADPPPQTEATPEADENDVIIAVRMLLEAVPGLARLELTHEPGEAPSVKYEIRTVQKHAVWL